MQELLADVGAEAIPLVARSIAVVVLTLVGGAVEVSAVTALLEGSLAFGLWQLYLGGVALYAGLFVLGPEVLSALDEDPDAPA